MSEIETAVAAAIRLLAEEEADNFTVILMEAEGVTAPVAERALAFVPLAFGRLLLSGMGITFAEECLMAHGGSTVTLPLKAIPVYQAALAAAQRTQSAAEFSPVALRSSEVAAVNNALNHGSQPHDLILGPPALTRVEATEEEIAAAAKKPKRSWWPF
jgi:hypothetical protein